MESNPIRELLGKVISQHPWLCLIVLLGLIATVAALGSRHAYVETTADSLMLKDDPAKKRFDQLRLLFFGKTLFAN